MMMALIVSSCLSLTVWLYLLLLHDRFWLADQRLARVHKDLSTWPSVLTVIPARDEADVISDALRSLLDQDYRGQLDIVVVDDGSSDGTGDLARALSTYAGANRSLRVFRNEANPKGWSGKLWAVHNGIAHAGATGLSAPILLLTDADIAHDGGSLTALVEKMVNDERDLVSLMVRLRVESFWERLLIPPFVFFFQMLYPFSAVNKATRTVAAAAGGCVLVKREALDDAGGIDAIKGDLIDDVALGRAIKRRPNGAGRIWLGLTGETVSLRAYDTLSSIWSMVARTADTQLGHSLIALVGTILGLIVVYLLPLFLALGLPLHQEIGLSMLGLAVWLAMCLAFWPTTALYGQAVFWNLTLPVAALFYAAMTIDSAIQYRIGRGGLWKGRVFVD